MQKAMQLRVHKLWDELAAFGAFRTEGALEHVLAGLADLLDAQQAYWLGTVRMVHIGPNDPVKGWRPRGIHYLHSADKFETLYHDQRRRIEAGKANPSIAPKVRDAGRFRVLIQHEIVPGGWLGSELHDRVYAPFGIQDIILVATPLGPDVESWFVFERIQHPDPCFGQDERTLLDFAVRPLHWLHHRIMLQRGIILADKPLTPSERRMLSELLTDKSEREIAETLELTPTTVHTYSKRIIRKFNVRGRAGLMALWLGQNVSSKE